MNEAGFVRTITEAMALPPTERHACFAGLHNRFYDSYSAALRRISAETAAQPARVEGEQRSIAQVVGHITAWERFALQGAADILTGVRHPRMVTGVEGFYDEDGSILRFSSIDEFNALFAGRQKVLPWQQIQAAALDTAALLHHLFTHPLMLTADRLERTRSHRRRMLDGSVLQPIAMGWSLWITVLEHIGVEHVCELGISEDENYDVKNA